MILVYFVAGRGGYQVRSMDFGGQTNKDFHLKSNLQSQQSALRYAERWVEHTGRKIDNECYIVRFPCFPYVGHGEKYAARILLAAMQDDRIYKDAEPRLRISYDRFDETIAKLLELEPDGEAMWQVMQKLNAKGRNMWLEVLLYQCQAMFNASNPGRELLTRWMRT